MEITDKLILHILAFVCALHWSMVLRREWLSIWEEEDEPS
jgi:hypothetical protein